MKKTKLKLHSSHAFSRGIILFIIIATLILFISDFTLMKNVRSTAQGGRLDLSNHYFNAQGITNLSGDWEQYHGLLTSEELVIGDHTPTYAPIASARADSNGSTFRLLITRRPENENLALRIPPAYGNYKLFVNGLEVASHSGYNAGYAYFSTGNAPELELILQVESSGHFYAGTNGTPSLGFADQIQGRMIHHWVCDLTLILFLLITALLSFALHLMDEQSKYYRFFGLSLIFGCIAVAGMREGLLFGATPFLPLLFTRKLAAVAAPLSILFLCQFFFHRFPTKSEKNETLRHRLVRAMLFASFLILVLPFWGFTVAVGAVLSRAIFIVGSFACLAAALSAMSQKVPFSGAYSFGALMLFFTHVIDIFTALFAHRIPFAWFSFALLSTIPFATFLKEFKDIRSDFGMTHFSLEQQANSARRELEDLKVLYEKQGMTDLATGISSRGFGEHILTTRTAENFGDIHPFTAVLLDVDDFTRINTQYGFDEGDAILMNTAVALSDMVGEDVTLCRWGSDEFLLIFPDCGAHEVPAILKELKQKMDRTNVSEREWISYCWGAATYDDSDTLLSFMKRLGDRLSEAKAQGRNSMAMDEPNSALQMNLFSE